MSALFGLAAADVGVGVFFNQRTAVLVRLSGTTATLTFAMAEDLDQLSGVVGPAVQYWLSDRFAVEAGGGLGFWRTPDRSQRGLGILLGAGAVIFSRGSHHLRAGAEYATALTDSGAVHSLGLTLGYQFRR